MNNNPLPITSKQIDDETRFDLVNNPTCIIFDGDFDTGTQRLSYIAKHGSEVYIKKYGKASQQAYEKLGLEYPGDPIYDPSLP